LAQAILAQAILLAWHGRTSALVAMAFADPWVHDDPWKNWRPSVAPTRPSASLAGALPTAIPPPELHAAIELMKATISAGASRQVATAVAAGLWRLATGSVHPRVQDSLPTVLASSSVEREVTARLAALAPSIRAQVAVQAVGAPQRSSSGLVPRDVHVLANAARHLYREGESFEHISPSIARAAQRGFRSHVKVDSEVVPEAAEVSEAPLAGLALPSPAPTPAPAPAPTPAPTPLLPTPAHTPMPTLAPTVGDVEGEGVERAESLDPFRALLTKVHNEEALLPKDDVEKKKILEMLTKMHNEWGLKDS